MSRRMMASAVFLVCLLAIAAAQPPGTGEGSGADKKVEPEKKKADPKEATDATVKAALANDPDVQIARAKMQLAEAEMAKAKQAVVIKVMSALANVEELKSTVEQNRERAAWSERMVKTGFMSAAQAQAERARLESSMTALARAETELKLITGGAKEPGPEPDSGSNSVAVHNGLLWLSRQRGELVLEGSSITLSALASQYASQAKAPVGAVPDRIRAALDKTVKLGAKGDKVTFEQALEVFKKDAGLDVPVRGPINQVGAVTSDGEELPVGAWFQLFEDHAHIPRTGFGQKDGFGKQLKGQFYVREYGILLSPTDVAPSDAPTLTEFWKQWKKKGLDPEAKDPEAMLQFLKHKRTEMSTRLGPNHPEMVALDRQIEQLEKDLKDRANKK